MERIWTAQSEIIRGHRVFKHEPVGFIDLERVVLNDGITLGMDSCNLALYLDYRAAYLIATTMLTMIPQKVLNELQAATTGRLEKDQQQVKNDCPP